MQEHLSACEAERTFQQNKAASDVIDAAEVSAQLKRFMEGSGASEGADVQQGPLAMDVKKLLKALQGVVGPLPTLNGTSARSSDSDDAGEDDSERTWSDISDDDEGDDSGEDDEGETASDVNDDDDSVASSAKPVGFMDQYMSELDHQMAQAKVSDDPSGEDTSQKPVDVDIDAVRSLLQSAVGGTDSSSGPANALLGMMGIRLPTETDVD